MSEIAQLYGPVDNLDGFVSPEFNRTFEFMTDKAVIELASRIVDRISESGYKQIVVSDCGARPLSYLCERIAKKRGMDLMWNYMKFPREQINNIYPLISYYLSKGEKDEKLQEYNNAARGDVLKKLCEEMPNEARARKSLPDILEEISRKGLDGKGQETYQAEISRALKGTSISKIIELPFLFFDEYVDSGTTLQNASYYFRFFTQKPDFKTISYYINIKESQKYPSICCSLFDMGSRKECFAKGAYPYENRIDIIGYFYHIDEKSYSKICLEKIADAFPKDKKEDLSPFLEKISLIIDENQVLEKYGRGFSVPAVRDYINKKHVIRHLLFVLESETHGKGVYADYLWQLADMYGPIWTPMPKANHLDFFKGSELGEAFLRGVNGIEELKKSYAAFRPGILTQSAEACLERKRAWYDRINNLLEGKPWK